MIKLNDLVTFAQRSELFGVFVYAIAFPHQSSGVKPSMKISVSPKLRARDDNFFPERRVARYD